MFLSLYLSQVTDKTDRQKAMHKNPPCICQGGLMGGVEDFFVTIWHSIKVVIKYGVEVFFDIFGLPLPPP